MRRDEPVATCGRDHEPVRPVTAVGILMMAEPEVKGSAAVASTVRAWKRRRFRD